MPDPSPDALRKLIAKWRKDGITQYSAWRSGADERYRGRSSSLAQCANELDALLSSARPGAGELSGWQPIATAPKDGTNFLACSYASSVFLAHWANGVVDSSSFDNDWGYHARFATHWMPLPDPTSAEGATPDPVPASPKGGSV